MMLNSPLNWTWNQTRALIGSAPAAYHANPEDLLLAGLCLGLEKWRGTPLSNGVLINLESRRSVKISLTAVRHLPHRRLVHSASIRSNYGPALTCAKPSSVSRRASARHPPRASVTECCVTPAMWIWLSTRASLSTTSAGLPPLTNNEDWGLVIEDLGQPVASSWKQAALFDINAIVSDNRLQFHLSYPRKPSAAKKWLP